MEFTVECQKRPDGKKANALRREGHIPAVLYGHDGTNSLSLTMDAKTAENLLRRASINNSLVMVKVPELSWSGKALLREVQTHPWKNELYHISFFSIAAQDSLQVTVPLHFVGEPIGVSEGRGALDTVKTELQVNCPPESIPESIEIDVSHLNIGDSIHVSELTLPQGVEVVDEPQRVVATVLAPTVPSAEEEAAEAEAASDATESGEDAAEESEDA